GGRVGGVRLVRDRERSAGLEDGVMPIPCSPIPDMSKKCCPNCGHFPATELHVCRGPETTAEQRTVKFWAARWQASQVELAGMATAWEDDRKTLSRKF